MWRSPSLAAFSTPSVVFSGWRGSRQSTDITLLFSFETTTALADGELLLLGTKTSSSCSSSSASTSSLSSDCEVLRGFI